MLALGNLTSALLLGLLELPATDPEELACLAANIYHEARGEALVGRRAVAHVTLNRVSDPSYPDSICEVVYQPYQFSWTNASNLALHEPEALHAAIVVALMVVHGLSADPTDGATHYYDHSRVTPGWSRVFETKVIIGGHTFQAAKG